MKSGGKRFLEFFKKLCERRLCDAGGDDRAVGDGRVGLKTGYDLGYDGADEHAFGLEGYAGHGY